MLSQIKTFSSMEQMYNISFSSIPKKKGIYIEKKTKEMNIEFSLYNTAIKEDGNKSMIYDAGKAVVKK